MPVLRWGIDSLRLISLLTFSILLAGCSSLRISSPLPQWKREGLVSVKLCRMALNAVALADREVYLELFDDYLPEIGIVAVWLSIENTSAEDLVISPRQWELLIGSKSLRPVSTDKLIDRYYKKRGIRMIAENLDRNSRRSLAEIELPAILLSRGARGEGFVFFDAGIEPGGNYPRQAILRGREILGPDCSKMKVEIPLTHANP